MSNPNPNPLSSASLFALIPHLLPYSSSSSSASLSLPTDVVAVLVHAIQTSLQFRLINRGTTSVSSTATVTQDEEPSAEPAQTDMDDETDNLSETETAVNDDSDEPLTSTSTNPIVSQESIQAAKLPVSWKERGEDSYTFEYKHDQSGLRFIVKVGRMGGRVNVSGMAEVSLSLSLSLYL